jgi:phosphate transport system permease protein
MANENRSLQGDTKQSLASFWQKGDPFVLLTASGLAMVLLLLVGMLLLVATKGLGVFWPHELEAFELADGKKYLAHVVGTEPRPGADGGESPGMRTNLKKGNRDVHGIDFVWVDDDQIVTRSVPEDAVLVERVEYGNLHGYLRSVGTPGAARLEGEALWEAAVEAVEAQEEKDKGLGVDLVFETHGGSQLIVKSGEIVHMWRPNSMSMPTKVGHYVSGVVGFLVDNPRESNTEGGVWPALFGTCMMVLIMSIVVTPFGVIAAVYLHEYAKQGPIVRAIRVAVANLAGVPSIVFGLFGLGFFIYTVGGTIDQVFFSSSLPTPTFGTGGILWASLTLALLTLPVVIVATEESLAAVPAANREGSLALGATKWETIRRVVLPASGPGIMTGLILAVARGAGEVAPLMLTGAIKLAPQMPFDGDWPFFHFDRKFMHLGFHIYDLGFQSPNVEAAKPMVYATTLLLLLLVVVLNVTAIRLRTVMRRRLQGQAF